MSESAHQAALMRWSRIREVVMPELKLLHAIPNGGARSKATAWTLKQEGVKAGVPDLCLPVARRGYHGLYIEMKNDKPKGVLSPDQRMWLISLREQGYQAIVTFGWEEAATALTEYLAVAA